MTLEPGQIIGYELEQHAMNQHKKVEVQLAILIKDKRTNVLVQPIDSYIDPRKIGEPVRIQSWKIKRFIPLNYNSDNECVELLKAVKEDLPKALELTNRALKTILKLDDKVNSHIKGDELYTYFDQISICPFTTIKSTPGSYQEVIRWNVTGWTFYPGSRVEPPDMSDRDLGDFPTYYKAVEEAVYVIARLYAEAFWIHEMNNALEQEYAQEKELF